MKKILIAFNKASEPYERGQDAADANVAYVCKGYPGNMLRRYNTLIYYLINYL